MNSKPLVTMYVPSYNRKRFIREALESVFAQTYSPMEIIICDDCSSDGTFDVIQNVVANYKGAHSIIINRNEKNLGLIGNINKVFSLAKGELISINCDDDISEPERVEVLVNTWLKHEKTPYVLFSSFRHMSLEGSFLEWTTSYNDGEITGSIVDFFKNPAVVGCTAAYRPEVMSVFGPIVDSGCYDDSVLFLRGRLLGAVVAINKPLLRYRDGGISSNAGSVETLWIKNFRAAYASYKQVYLDSLKLEKLSSEDEVIVDIRSNIADILHLIEARLNLVTGNFFNRMSAFHQLRLNSAGQPKILLFLLAIIPRMLTRCGIRLYYLLIPKKGH